MVTGDVEAVEGVFTVFLRKGGKDYAGGRGRGEGGRKGRYSVGCGVWILEGIVWCLVCKNGNCIYANSTVTSWLCTSICLHGLGGILPPALPNRCHLFLEG